jgi:hypothetical protein
MYSYVLLMMDGGPPETCGAFVKINKFKKNLHLVGCNLELLLISALSHTAFFSVSLRPNAGHGLLILDVSRLHKTTHYSR